MSEEFKNGGFILKTLKCFPSTLRWRNLTTQQSPVILGCVWLGTGQGNRLIIVTSLFRKAPLSKCFPSTRKRKVGAFKVFKGLNLYECYP